MTSSLIDNRAIGQFLGESCDSAGHPTGVGLSALVFTSDHWRIDRALRDLRAGIVKFNAPISASEAHASSGGEKASSGRANVGHGTVEQ